MPIDWTKFDNLLLEEGHDLLQIIKPYLSALSRQGPEVFDGFIRHLTDNNWTEVDALMYDKMTAAERRELQDEVISGLRAAAIARFERKKLTKEILYKILLSLLTKVL